MRTTTHLRVGLALGLITVVGAAVGMAFWALAHPTTSPGTGAAALDAALTVALAWLGCLLTVWLTAAGALATLAQLDRPWAAKARAGADWLAPAAVRRFAALLVGATIASAAAPVTAVGQEPHRDRTTISALARAPEPSLLIADDLAGPDPSLVGSDPAAAPDAGWLPTRPPALPIGHPGRASSQPNRPDPRRSPFAAATRCGTSPLATLDPTPAPPRSQPLGRAGMPPTAR